MSFSILYQNVRGLRTKTDTAFLNLSVIDKDFFCLTETWLKEGIYTSELFNNLNYITHRRDRDYLSSGTCRGGGVLVIHKKKNQNNRNLSF